DHEGRELPVRLLVEVLFLTCHLVLPCALAGQHTIPVEEIVIVLIFPRSRFTGRLSSARIPVRERRGDTTHGFCFKPLPVQFPWTDRQETSMSIEALRKHLLELLEGGHAHLDFETAIADLPVELRGVRPQGLPHTPWRLLEHMRIAQWDILRFSIDPDHAWPGSDDPPRGLACGRPQRLPPGPACHSPQAAGRLVPRLSAA